MPRASDDLCVTVHIDDTEYALIPQPSGEVKVYTDGNEAYPPVRLDKLHYALAERVHQLENQLAEHKEKQS